MDDKVKIAGVLLGGYLLGRSRKMKLALMVAGAVTGNRAFKNRREILAGANQFIIATPELKALNEKVAGRLSESGKNAAVALASKGVDSLSANLQERTEQLASTLDSAKEEASPEDESPEDESREGKEADDDQASEDVEEDESLVANEESASEGEKPPAEEEEPPAEQEKEKKPKKAAPRKRTVQSKSSTSKSSSSGNTATPRKRSATGSTTKSTGRTKRTGGSDG